MRKTLLARLVFAVFAAVSAFALAYVAWVHVVAARHRMSSDVRDFHEELGALPGLPAGFTVRHTGGLGLASRGGTLRVTGAGKSGDELVVATAARRFDDGVVTFRFRLPNDAGEAGDALEAFVGFEQVATKRTLTAAFVGGDEPFVHVGGDVSGPARTGRAVTEAKVTTKASEWHTLAIQFAPVFDTVGVAFDGRPVSSLPVHWFQGTESKIVFGVRLRKDVANVDAAFGSIGLATLDWQNVTSFDDHFSGEILDTHRWLFNLPDPDLGTLTSEVDPKRGLSLDVRMRSIAVDPSFGFMLRTFPFPLRTMKVRVELTIEELTDATIFVGLMGASEWSPPARVFDAGIVSRGGHPIVFTAGAWKNDGSLEFVPGPPITVPHALTVDLAYDAQTEHARLAADERPIEDRVIDLKPLDMVAVRVGALGHGPEARARVRVTRATLLTSF